MSRHGFPVPRAWRADTWQQVLAAAGDPAGHAVVVKAERGTGRGREVIAPPLPSSAPFPGPYLIEEFVANDGVDRKLYVAGERVFGRLKPSTLDAPHGAASAEMEVDDGLRVLALGVALATDLHLLGVDVVSGPRGPVIIDVNPFPGYRGVGGAAAAVAAHLLDHLGVR